MKNKNLDMSVKSTQRGLREGLIRATYIVQKDLDDKIKALAYWDRCKVKEIVNEALENYLRDKEIKPIPTKKKS